MKIFVFVIAVLTASMGAAQADMAVTVGVLTDMSSLYKDNSGQGSVEAAKMAVEDFHPEKYGMNVKVVSADHQNKPDVGAGIARKWYDVDNVDMIVDIPNSSIAFAVSEIAKAKNKVVFVSSAGSSDLTGKACTKNLVHFTYDTWSLAQIAGKELVKSGKRNWFFVTADYAFGHALERDASEVVKAQGGSVVGSVRAPINSSDFSSFLLQAQASNADVVAFANSGADFINSMKQATEFGLGKKEQLAGLLVFITDIRSLGLKVTQGLSFADAFYWDFDDQTRAWSKRFQARNNGVVPTMGQAGVYSSTLRYLEGVRKVGSAADGEKVVAEIKSSGWDDPLFGPTKIRSDGRAVHRMLFVQVKTPSESTGPDDLYNVKTVISPEDAFRPMSDICPLAAK